MKKRLSQTLLSRTASRMGHPLKQALINALDTIHSRNLDDLEFAEAKESIMVLFIEIMKADGDINDNEVELVSNYFKNHYGQDAVNRFRVLLHQKEGKTLKQACDSISSFSNNEKTQILEALLNVAYADGTYVESEKKVIDDISRYLEITDEIRSEVEVHAEKAAQKHSTLIKSSAGLIAALVIILIFILTATFLKSVLFGLILAYFFLPLQRWYADSFFNNGFVAKCVNGINACFKPFSAIAAGIRGLFSKKGNDISNNENEPISAEEKHQRAVLRRSCHATLLSVTLSGAAAVLLLTWVSTGYFNAAKESLSSTTEESSENWAHQWINKVNPDLIKMPLVKKIVTEAEELVADEERVTEFKNNLQKQTGGIFGMIVNFLGGLVSFLLNLLLSIFFFSFFLEKMADFQFKSSQQKSIGDYLVESIFQSGWLPKTSTETQKGAAGIIDVIAMKLQTWVRGYLWIIIIETIVYVSIFLSLGVPYAVILGGIAGLTVLLPFLGPLASAVITLGACIVMGHTSPALLITIVVIYFIMNMVIEQLFLYPAFVGEALGLNILETIAVVLLGGVLAGIAGVIFAVPAASILKYLIPKVYRTVSTNRKDSLNSTHMSSTNY